MLHRTNPEATLQSRMLRVILDTNVVLDCFVFRDPGIETLLARLEQRDAIAVTNAATLDELERVLAYGKIVPRAAGAAPAALIARYRSVAEHFAGPSRIGHIPTCRDPDDQKFLELARDAAARFLITKDRALLDLAPRRFGAQGFRIITPRMFASATAT